MGRTAIDGIGRKTKYPWKKWTNGRTHTFLPDGYDPQRWQSYLHARAKAWGMTCITRQTDDGQVTFRFSRKK